MGTTKKHESIEQEAWRLIAGRPLFHSLVRSVTAAPSAKPGETSIELAYKLPVEASYIQVPNAIGNTALKAVLGSHLPAFEARLGGLLGAFLPVLSRVEPVGVAVPPEFEALRRALNSPETAPSEPVPDVTELREGIFVDPDHAHTVGAGNELGPLSSPEQAAADVAADHAAKEARSKRKQTVNKLMQS